MMVPDWLVTAVGSIAAICTTVAFIPQLVRVWRLRRADEISSTTFALFSVGTLVWLVYGVFLSSWPIILANGITLCLAAAILALKIAWGDAPRPEPS
jgi:MtN3 and saliva related transmembrane protein